MCRELKRLDKSCTSKVAVRADGGAAREDDAEAESLDEDAMFLGDGEVVAMAVKELPPLVWRTFAEGRVVLSEEGGSGDSVYGGRSKFVDNYGSGADRGQALLGSGAAVREQR
jgi:hypothetical protein